MYPLVRIDKHLPDGSIWQSRRSYLLPDVEGWTRVYGPAGTRWSNPLGGWTTDFPGVSIFNPGRAFTISCSGPATDLRFYIDVAHRVRVDRELIVFVDLYLDILIDAAGAVTEKDEQQLSALPADLQRFARSARDEVQKLIASGDPLFDSRSRYFAIPNDAAALPPARERLAID
jgi:hypothetical protein